MARPPPPPVRALLFDVFGTLVDWRGGIAREVATLAYKPQPVVYLASAAAVGLRTAFIARPDEFGPGRGESAPQGLQPDWVAGSLLELADELQRECRAN